ncbi:hypothetical protein G9A89_019775 [Geosiphon pyriformis]|nr:hypothetical protein G9A89_019775 [Geosiphon pyriformis]
MLTYLKASAVELVASEEKVLIFVINMNNDDYMRRLIILSFWVVVLVGLPFWWKTTEIYRAQLPFSEIEEWEVFELEFPLLFSLHLAFDQAHKPFHEELGARLKESLNQAWKDFNQNIGKFDDLSTLSSMPNKTVVFKAEVMSIPWEGWESLNQSASGKLMVWVFGGFPALSHSDLNLIKNGRYDFYIMPSGEITKLKVGNKRQAILQVGTKDWDVGTIEKILVRLITSFFAEEQETILQVFHEQAPQVNPSSMRTLKYSPLYQITFSLMNGDPSTQLVDWEIEEAVSSYLKPFLDETSVISDFTIDSQIQHYAALTFDPQHYQIQPDNDDSLFKPYFYLTPQSLPHFINSAEWNLASAVSSYPTLNFILYVPSKKNSPLVIHDAKGLPTLSNAFLIPRWGGIVISNPEILNGTYTFNFVRLKFIMEIFVSQLRGLLGVREFKSTLSLDELKELSIEIDYISPLNMAITSWELDNLIRRRIAENILATASTLKSLSQLVSAIPNMVVLDHIQTEVLDALASLKKSCESLRMMQYDLALEYAKQAIARAESAFFDPTMVSMLYFPDEHKYAIYMPLFVPISVPLLVTLLRELREFKAKRQTSKEIGKKEV